MPEGSSPIETGIAQKFKGLIEKVRGRNANRTVDKPSRQPISPSIPDREPVEFDDRGEAKGPWAVQKSSKSDDFILIDTRTGELAGSYADIKEAQRRADRGNAMEALRKQIKKEQK